MSAATLHERYVIDRFDALEGRFREAVAADDYRLVAVREALGDVRGLRVLDLGCGKGRFAVHLQAAGAAVVGMDPSAVMLRKAPLPDRLRATATRLPFATGVFDRVMAVEVLEHLTPSACDAALREMRRVLRPGGRVAIVDKSVWALDARRPWLPKVVVKRIDERRGRWMYPRDAPARERWFRPGALTKRLRSVFGEAASRSLLSPEESRVALFRRVPASRLMTLWTARVPGGAA